MGKKLCVGKLSPGLTDKDLQNLFATYGEIDSALIIRDRDTGKSKGFGFVMMGNDEEAQGAVYALNCQIVNGLTITVNEVQGPEERGGIPPGFAGGRGHFRGGRRY